MKTKSNLPLRLLSKIEMVKGLVGTKTLYPLLNYDQMKTHKAITLNLETNDYATLLENWGNIEIEREVSLN